VWWLLLLLVAGDMRITPLLQHRMLLVGFKQQPKVSWPAAVHWIDQSWLTWLATLCGCRLEVKLHNHHFASTTCRSACVCVVCRGTSGL
jgi:hypothetical protein